MTKEQKIEAYLKEPIKVGDPVNVRGLNHHRPNDFCDYFLVKDVDEDGSIYIDKYGGSEKIEKKDYKKSTRLVGVDPFPKNTWNSRLQIINFNLYSILHKLGLEKRKRYLDADEVNWDPIVLDKDGNEVKYQRDFCWSLKDKQLLIESVYNNIDIGKIVIRNRSFEYVRNRKEKGKEVAFHDIVDGKQRLNALLGFVKGEFEDLHGNRFEDLSEKAQDQFFNFQSVAYGELGEQASDEDVKAVFLGVNFAGVPMSKEHVEFVKSINL